MRVDRKQTQPVETPVSSVRPVIHNVMISDASGSMGGAKYRASCESIQEELKILRTDPNADYLITLVEFANSGAVTTEHAFKIPIHDMPPIRFRGANGGTPLYITIGNVLSKLEAQVKPDERVLVKIFTDGDDTEHGRGEWNSKNIATYINKLIGINKWTLTFNCTASDKYAIMRIGIPESNILTHDNTAEGIQEMSMLRSAATMYYSKSVAGGASADSMVASFYSKSVNP